MKNYRSITSMLAFVLVFAVVAATAADAPKLKFKFFTHNVPDALQTYANGINNAGVTVGIYQDTSKVWHGYILKGKDVTTLDDPNAPPETTNAEYINYNGAIKVVGFYSNSARTHMGFLYEKGTFTDIPGPAGAISSEANGINDKKEIVGDYIDSSGVMHGFLLKGTEYTTLDVPGASTIAWQVNNKDRIVLSNWYSPAHTYIYNVKTKKFQKIKDVPGAVNSYGTGLNNEGDISFFWDDSSGKRHGALCPECASKNRKYYKYDYPKAVWTLGAGINDKQTIVGTYQAQTNGPYSGYKATFK